MNYSHKVQSRRDGSKEKFLAPWKESCDKPRQHIKKQRHHFADKGPYSQSYGFSSSHVWVWELDHEESWAPKNWCFWTVQFSSVQSLSCVWLFETPWIAACQASLSVTNSRSSPRLTSIESVMPSSHLILCHPLLLLPSNFPSISVFSNE